MGIYKFSEAEKDILRVLPEWIPVNVPWSPFVYDDNENSEIEFNEMVNALMDYLSSKLIYPHMIDALMCYLTG